MPNSVIPSKVPFKLSHDFFEYIGLRTKAVTRMAELRAGLTELESTVAICDLIYGQSLLGTNAVDCLSPMHAAVGRLAQITEASEWN